MPLLFQEMSYSQDELSFSVFEYSQAVGNGAPFIKLAKMLGIQWFLMADGDNAGSAYLRLAENELKDGEHLDHRARQLAYTDIEHEFWHNGFGEFMATSVPENQKNEIENEDISEEAKIKKLIKVAINKAGGKPAFAQRLATEVNRRGPESIPQTIQDIIRHFVLFGRELENA